MVAQFRYAAGVVSPGVGVAVLLPDIAVAVGDVICVDGAVPVDVGARCLVTQSALPWVCRLTGVAVLLGVAVAVGDTVCVAVGVLDDVGVAVLVGGACDPVCMERAYRLTWAWPCCLAFGSAVQIRRRGCVAWRGRGRAAA